MAGDLAKAFKLRTKKRGGCLPLVRTPLALLLTTPSSGLQTPARKTMQGERRSHARMAMAEPQGFL